MKPTARQSAPGWRMPWAVLINIYVKKLFSLYTV